MPRNLPRHFVVDGSVKIRYDRALDRGDALKCDGYMSPYGVSGSAVYKPAVAPTILAVSQRSA